MGLDLSIMPAYGIGLTFSTDALEFSRDSNLFTKIKSLPSGEASLTSYPLAERSPDKKYHTKDAYGNNIKFVYAKYLKRVCNFDAQDWKNNAIFSYIEKLPDNLEIYLFWH